jgi:hypothetical protein
MVPDLKAVSQGSLPLQPPSALGKNHLRISETTLDLVLYEKSLSYRVKATLITMPATVVTVTLEDLKNGKLLLLGSEKLTEVKGNVSFSTLEEAFGPDSLGILLVKDVPSEFVELRHRLLSYSSYLGNLPAHSLGQNSLCYARFLNI